MPNNAAPELARQRRDHQSHRSRPTPDDLAGPSSVRPTILFGGFTWKHHRLLQGVLHALGYRAEILPTPDSACLQTGKECGNTGQCNPTYFTVGNLIRYLRNLERGGLSRRQIVERYVLITAGACGPCRFGMYEAEYRLALRNAGFHGFRVLLFQQKAGLSQGGDDAGIRYDEDFFLGLLTTMIIADQLNDIAYQVRPYEVKPGATDRVLEDSIERLYRFFSEDRPADGIPVAAKILGRLTGRRGRPPDRLGWLRLLGCRRVAQEMESIAEAFAAIEVDYLRVRPIVKITGEFWAQLTEGDGNFNMFRFLESEGAQVRVEPISAWITYLLRQARQWHRDRQWLPARPELERLLGAAHRAGGGSRGLASLRKRALLRVAEWAFRREWRRSRSALRGIPASLADQDELARLGHRYYHTRARGGEGHLEVAESIYFCRPGRAHMVLSLKPFGCMPSTQSDGVQAWVASEHPEVIFLPVETSGEGEVNAHSRVQMTLTEARSKARIEYEQALGSCRRSEQEIRDYARVRPELRHAMLDLPADGVTGTAARYVRYVASLMSRDPSAPGTAGR